MVHRSVGRHVHHRIAAPWLDQQTDDLLLCRVTQMSLLRLLSNPAIMGDDGAAPAVAHGASSTSFGPMNACSGPMNRPTGPGAAGNLSPRRHQPRTLDR